VRRAYDAAGIDPLTVDLIEAHGTGTRAGDPAEFEGLAQVFGKANGQGQHIAIGSVKSQIGHTKAAAGIAGLMKAALALDQKVFPPTNNVDEPNPKLEIESTPFYINTIARPWIRAEGAPPRRAAVSAFGFGGTNYHVVMEEYQADHAGAYRLRRVTQPVLLHAPSTEALVALCEETLSGLKGDDGDEKFRAVADESKAAQVPLDHPRLGFVADNLGEAVGLLEAATKFLRARPDAESWEHPKGIFYRREGMDPDGHLVVVFPGQGSQYLEMGRELVMNFPPLRDLYGKMDALFLEQGSKPLSSVVFPPPAFDDDARKEQSRALRATDYAQAGIGVFSAGLFNLLRDAGLQPDFTAGHSFGELSALWAGGILSDGDFLRLVKARGKAMAPPDDPDFDAGGMLAVKGALEEIEREVEAFEDVIIANQNSGSQVVLAGPTSEIRRANDVLEGKGYKVTLLPVSAAFHTPLVEHASAPFAKAVDAVEFHGGDAAVYSNTTGDRYPEDAEEAKSLLANHILNPVFFKRQIEHIYDAGGRIFIECGPRRITTNLVQEILADKPHAAVPLNASRQKSSDRQFREAVIQLRVVGVRLGDVDPYEVA
jgi:polyketide-type polyunsaturated fatty acid synthase PfaA